MDRPILFSTPMVNALLAGAKTQTRRVIKIDADGIEPHEELPGEFAPWKHGERLSTILCPYGAAGDCLWVRESFRIEQRGNRATGEKFDVFVYRADSRMRPEFDPLRYKPSIHMPRAASRITLRITDVRCERLQEISEEDAKAEGAAFTCDQCGNDLDEENGAEVHAACDREYDDRVSHAIGYRRLWGRINGKRAPWDSNPWVWVVCFTSHVALKR